MRVWIDIKGKINENKLYGEKNRGSTYVPRFIILYRKLYNYILLEFFFKYKNRLIFYTYKTILKKSNTFIFFQ